MSVQNAVVRHGQVVGYRCRECSGVFESMWGSVCNGCSAVERRHKESLAAQKVVNIESAKALLLAAGYQVIPPRNGE